MEQKKLEDKVRKLFKNQGFEVESIRNGFEVVKEDVDFILKVFSSEKFSLKDLKNIDSDNKVFVDKGLSGIEEKIPNEVSVLEEDKAEKFDTPSYEVIGDIAVISELSNHTKKQAVEGIKNQQNVKTIMLKKGGLKGQYRVGEYELLYGDETQTIHTEFGCRYKVDLTKVFFSEREATERKRVMENVSEGENILVMFCGIGPYPILIARKVNSVDVVGVEKNPEAVDYAEENVRINNVMDSVSIIEGDVKEKVPGLGSFDRVIMPSPTNAQEYILEALVACKDGAEVTFYRIVEKEDKFEQPVEEFKEIADQNSLNVEILDRRVVSDYSPHQQKVAVDFKVNF